MKGDGRGKWFNYLIFLDKTHKSRSFDFDGLARTIVQGDDEVEEIGFTQIRRRLLLEVSSSYTQPAGKKKKIAQSRDVGHSMQMTFGQGRRKVKRSAECRHPPPTKATHKKVALGHGRTKIGKFSWKSRRFARPTLKCWPWPATKQWRSVARSTEKIGRNHFPFPRNEWTVSGERNFVETCGNGLCLSWIELTYALWSTMAAGIQPLEANGRPMLAEKSTLRSGCICDDDGWWSCIRWPSTDVTKVKM